MCVCVCVCVCVRARICVRVRVRLGSMFSLRHIWLDIIDILYLCISVSILSNRHIHAMIYFPKYFQTSPGPSSGDLYISKVQYTFLSILMQLFFCNTPPDIHAFIQTFSPQPGEKKKKAPGERSGDWFVPQQWFSPRPATLRCRYYRWTISLFCIH